MAKRVLGWKRELLGAHDRIAGLFARSEPRARSLAYVQGLLSACERKNGWQLAEWMGEPAPHRMQHLLDRACWDADAARDRVRDYVLDALSGEESVLIVDETGFLKKGVRSVGVKRQYTGQQAASRTARWAYSFVTRVIEVRLCWTANCIFPKSGPPMPNVAAWQQCRKGQSLRPSRSWRGA
jgi:SRSO17 transposase